LGKVHIACFELVEERMHVADFDSGEDQGGLSRRKVREVRLMDAPQMQTRSLPA
jgi:hypothetical protein